MVADVIDPVAPAFKSANKVIPSSPSNKPSMYSPAKAISFLIFSSQMSYFFEVSLLKGFYFLFAALVVSYLNHCIGMDKYNVN